MDLRTALNQIVRAAISNMSPAAIDKLLRDETLVNSLVRAGYRNVALYSPEAIAETYCSLYDRII